ncbi:MAG: c-type cytochrome [Alphaproteobacteria bacterium]|nr:c-type cytochrome [Alphaproteobacteria bacterium]
MRTIVVAALAVWSLASAARADEPAPVAFDAFNAKQIMMVCATCHGEFGQGGGGGVYPRLSGLPAAYLADQLRLFKVRKRENIPMIPYTHERELPERDLVDISGFLASIELQTRLPEIAGPIDGLERLQQAKRTLQIPRAPGDVEAGGRLYASDCAVCHGKAGEGRGNKPRLAGQHTPYLDAQLQRYKTAKGDHPDREDLFAKLTADQMRDVLAHLSVLDD